MAVFQMLEEAKGCSKGFLAGPELVPPEELPPLLLPPAFEGCVALVAVLFIDPCLLVLNPEVQSLYISNNKLSITKRREDRTNG